MDSTYLRLKPVKWSQEIRSYPSIQVQGRHLRATCTAEANSDLVLRDGSKLHEFEIHLAIMEGEPNLQELEKSKLPEKALGGIWWIGEQSFVHGWFI